MTVTCCAPFDLTPVSASPEMTSVAFGSAPRHPGAVLMPLIIDDSFYDDLGASLPARSLSLLLPAASWSARRSKSGFVPAWMVAKLSDDPDRDTGPLQAAGIVRRVKGGGMQITEGKGITIINADVAEAEAERKREQGRLRSQRKRDRDKAARTAAITAGVTQPSRASGPGVTRTERAKSKKPQVAVPNVTRYEAGSSRVTDPIDRSNQDLSIGGHQVDARAREEDPAVVADVAAALCEVTGRDDIGEPEALRAIGVIRDRARRAKRKIRSPKYFRTAVLNEADPYDELLLPAAPPSAEIFADPVPPGEVHLFNPDPRPGMGEVCQDCPKLRSNRVHKTELREAI